MSYLDAFILGAVQGLTEFLPVSSSGHLVLTEQLLGVDISGVTFELLVHLGTVAAVLIYFRSRIFAIFISLFNPKMKPERKLILMLAAGTIPAGLAGYFLEDFFESFFTEPAVTSAFLIVTGFILLSTRFCPKDNKPIGYKSALIMGIGQAMAILPGISRSGSTIASGMLAGVKPSEAAEFSFLMAIPVILGATLLKAGELASLKSDMIGPYVCGVVTSLIFGLAAVYLVLATIRRGRFEYFAYYCFTAGGLGLYLLL